tara:strand:+ start:15640 stop:15969 length:330 start_codon:yes stop_codon:yes gene_type:complete
MINGLYAVHFRTAGDEGTGTVVITNGSVNGGDAGYTYQGSLQESGQGVSATLSVVRFNPNMKSVFGQAESFELEVSGPISDRSFELTGNVKGSPGQKIDISGHYLKPLV